MKKNKILLYVSLLLVTLPIFVLLWFMIRWIVAFDNCWNQDVYNLLFALLIILLYRIIYGIIFRKKKKIYIVFFIINILMFFFNIFYYVNYSIKIETSFVFKQYNIPSNEVEIVEIIKSNEGIYSPRTSRSIKYRYNNVEFKVWYDEKGWYTYYEETPLYNKINE